jgi:hypothetical protein
VNKGNDGQNGLNGGDPPPDPFDQRVQVTMIAALLAERRQRVSLRVLAREIGISKSALDGMVKAYHEVREIPQPHANWQKLKGWYLTEKRKEAAGLSDPVDMGLLALEMLAELPEAERRAGVRELVEAMTQIFARRRLPQPAWVVRLAEAGDVDPSIRPEPRE